MTAIVCVPRIAMLAASLVSGLAAAVEAAPTQPTIASALESELQARHAAVMAQAEVDLVPMLDKHHRKILAALRRARPGEAASDIVAYLDAIRNRELAGIDGNKNPGGDPGFSAGWEVGNAISRASADATPLACRYLFGEVPEGFWHFWTTGQLYASCSPTNVRAFRMAVVDKDIRSMADLASALKVITAASDLRPD